MIFICNVASDCTEWEGLGWGVGAATDMCQGKAKKDDVKKDGHLFRFCYKKGHRHLLSRLHVLNGKRTVVDLKSFFFTCRDPCYFRVGTKKRD